MDKFIKKALNDEKYMLLIDNIYNNKFFKEIDNFIHHNNYTRLDHCLHVSYSVYLYFKKHNPKYQYLQEACNGALLHDFFLYDWHKNTNFRFPCMHAWKHPMIAFKNASKYFKIDKIEKDIIVKHMFPISKGIPLTKASWLTTFFDKYWAVREALQV